MSTETEILKDLAGPAYFDLTRSKNTALQRLCDSDPNVRIAAIRTCEKHWEMGRDVRFLELCKRSALTDSSAAVRIHALRAIASSLSASRNSAYSQVLADIVATPQNDEFVRKAAYWALREVQLGPNEEDIVQKSMELAKLVVSKLSTTNNVEQAKEAFLGTGLFPNIGRATASEIDMDFVGKYISAVPRDGGHGGTS